MPDPVPDPAAARPPDPDEDGQRVLAYHDRSKHHRHRYAPAPPALDWANQPDPFRTFAGAPAVELPLLADALRTSYADLYVPAPAGPRRADVNSVAVLFELALGLSAWKEYGTTRWALRCNPSSGNLHPTEGYAVLPDLPGLGGGVYHYVSRDHPLELRRRLAPAETAALPPGCLLVGLSSVHWREAWKYGERAFRYCQHDAGHALAAVRYAAAALGWSARLLDHAGDDDVAAWLGLDAEDFAGLDPADREHPAALVLVGPAPLPDAPPVPPPPAGGPWLGRANRLSPDPARWDLIDVAAAAARAPAGAPQPVPAAAAAAAAAAPRRPGPPGRGPDPAAPELPGPRRPDGPRRRDLLPDARPPAAAAGRAPWDLLPWAPLVHPACSSTGSAAWTPGSTCSSGRPGRPPCGPRARRGSTGRDRRAARTTCACTGWPGGTTGRRRRR